MASHDGDNPVDPAALADGGPSRTPQTKAAAGATDDLPPDEDPDRLAKDADRRRSPRILVDLEVDYGAEDTFLFAYITDMSALGIFMRTHTPQPAGTLLHLRFTLPGEASPLAVEGRVMWINPYRPGDVNNLNPGMGVKFVNLNQTDRRKVHALVRKIAYLDDDARKLDTDDPRDAPDESQVTATSVN